MIYAQLLDRVKALVIDAIVIIAAMYALSELFSLFDHVNNSIRQISFVVVFLLYEPLFVSINGATIGHTYSNIAVRNVDKGGGKISFFKALIRFLTKSFLGWFSLLTVTGDEKKRALHDLLAGSVVIETQTKQSTK